MKLSIPNLCILAALGFSACVKDAVEKPEFKVDINKTTFNAGDTAKFTLSGIPYNLVFYSGEAGNDYYARNIYTAKGGVSSMVFSTALTAASGSSTETNLKILVSNSFSGNFNKEQVLNANWVDVTSQVSVPGNNQTINLDPFKMEGKPIYVAFRFLTTDETKSQRQVTVSGFSFKTVFPDQTYTNASNVYFAGFASFDFGGDAANFWSIPTTSNTNNSFSHPFVPANSAKDDDWAISTGFNTAAIAPSTGISIKSISSNPTSEYRYVFAKAGIYKVVFVASNNNADDYKEVLKEFTVTVQ
jgi:hypothetical protein